MSDQEYSASLLQALDTKIEVLDAQPDDLLAIGKALGLMEAKLLIHAKNLDAVETSKCFTDVSQRVRRFYSVLERVIKKVL